MNAHALRCPLFLLLLAIVVLIVGIQTVACRETLFIKNIVGKGLNAVSVGVEALQADIGTPSAVVQSSKGDLYIASRFKSAILKVHFNSDGTSMVSIVAGTGTNGYGADGVPAIQSALYAPMSVTLIENEDGDVTAILIADGGTRRIRRVDMSSGYISTIAGGGSSTDDGTPAISFGLSGPYQALYNKTTGDILIVDYYGNAVRKLSGSDGLITTVVGKCTVSGLGDGGPAINACLSGPAALAINDAGEWFIVDQGNKLIRKVDLQGNIHTVAGGGARQDGPATEVMLYTPTGIALTPSGELLVADQYGSVPNRILKMDHKGFMTIIASGLNSGTQNDDDILATKAKYRPNCVAYATDGSDDIFICDDNRYIKKLHAIECYGVKSNTPAICSGRGSCMAPDQCECDDGWMGTDCTITHCFGITSNLPSVCSGKGQCVRHNKCHCHSGFTGRKCQKQPEEP